MTAAHPAHPGETIVIFATGLGEVEPQVASGLPAPATPLSRTAFETWAQIGGLQATVLFAGLTPGFAGLYQVNAVVPQLATGLQDLTITTFRTPSTPVKIAIE